MQSSKQISPITYLLVLLPLIAFGLLVAVVYGDTYFLRRDENIFFAVLQGMQDSQSRGEVVLMVLPPVVMQLFSATSSLLKPLVLGRLLALLSGVACALLVVKIARCYAAQSQYVPFLSLTLLLSSSLYVYESSFTRFNLPSLAFALAGIYLLVRSPRWQAEPKAAAIALFGAGLLLGIGLQLKPLILMVAPFLAYLVCLIAAPAGTWRPQAKLLLQAAGLHALGWFVPALLMLLLGGAGFQVANQLGAHLSETSFISAGLRISHSISVVIEFIEQQLWLVLLALASFVLGARAEAQKGLQQTSLFALGFWALSSLLVLMINFPSWDHHFVYLLPPLAIAAALFLERALNWMLQERKQKSIRLLSEHVIVLLFALVLVAMAMMGALTRLRSEQVEADLLNVVAQIKQRSEPNDLIWSDNLVVPLLSGRPSERELLDLSVKRIISGKLTEREVFGYLAQHPPRAVVVYDGLFDAFPKLIACLEAHSERSLISLNNQRIYWLSGDLSGEQACQP